MPIEGTQISQKLKNEGVTGDTPIYFYDNIRIPAKTRICSGDKYDITCMDKNYYMPHGRSAVLIFPEKQKKRFDLKGYKVIVGSSLWANLHPRFHIEAIQRFVDRMNQKNKLRYLIAFPPKTDGSESQKTQ